MCRIHQPASIFLVFTAAVFVVVPFSNGLPPKNPSFINTTMSSSGKPQKKETSTSILKASAPLTTSTTTTSFPAKTQVVTKISTTDTNFVGQKVGTPPARNTAKPSTTAYPYEQEYDPKLVKIYTYAIPGGAAVLFFTCMGFLYFGCCYNRKERERLKQKKKNRREENKVALYESPRIQEDTDEQNNNIHSHNYNDEHGMLPEYEQENRSRGLNRANSDTGSVCYAGDDSDDGSEYLYDKNKTSASDNKLTINKSSHPTRKQHNCKYSCPVNKFDSK